MEPDAGLSVPPAARKDMDFIFRRKVAGELKNIPRDAA
jgi:hypothetical protein